MHTHIILTALTFFFFLFHFNPNTQPAILTQTISQQTDFARELIVVCMLLATTNAVRI